jgi:hypothetical protein
VLELSKPIPRRRGRQLRLSSLHVDQGLLHGLKHLCLHNQHLLKSRRRGWWRVDILVVLPIVVPIVVVIVVPCVGHLRYYVDEIKITQENDSRGTRIGIDP